MEKKLTLIISLAIAGILSFSNVQAQPGCHPHHHHGHQHGHINKDGVKLMGDMRKLWEDHITWTRNVILNILDDLPGTNEAVGRLLQNQEDIGDALKPLYGNWRGNKLTNLLYGHINIAAALLTALKNNDTVALNAANTAWYANADSIARFLHRLNPDEWSYQELSDMMNEHLALTTTEAVARKTSDYAADVAAYDSVHIEILEMADFLSLGIIRQFPNLFHSGNKVSALTIDLSDASSMLSQNEPNPFTDQTVINYFIPDNVNTAEIVFYNSSGNLIKSIAIVEKGEGNLTVNADNLARGTYSYSIIADGKVIDTKKMVH